MTPTQIALYQAEVARRNKEGIPVDEQPSLLSQASCEPSISRFWSATIRGQPQIGVTINDVELGNLGSEPPAISEFLLSLLGPKDQIDSMLGDFEERFHSDLEAVSAPRARWRYRGRVWRSIGPLIFNRLKNWGFFAFVFEVCRRKIGW